MEAGNMGAHLGGGTSVGLNIVLPFEQHLTRHDLNLITFFVRKVMFVKYSQGFVVMPEVLVLGRNVEAITLIQTKKIARFPLFL
jgi:hypothetical protein